MKTRKESRRAEQVVFDQQLLTLRQFTTQLGLSYEWGKKAMSRREFSVVRYVRRALIPASEVARFINMHLIPAAEHG
jgi:hypothetical protein